MAARAIVSNVVHDQTTASSETFEFGFCLRGESRPGILSNQLLGAPIESCAKDTVKLRALRLGEARVVGYLVRMPKPRGPLFADYRYPRNSSVTRSGCISGSR